MSALRELILRLYQETNSHEIDLSRNAIPPTTTEKKKNKNNEFDFDLLRSKTCEEILSRRPIECSSDIALAIPWAKELIKGNGIIPLLKMIQSIERDVLTLAPLEQEHTAGELCSADAALLVLAEVANCGQVVLESLGYDVDRDRESGKCLYVHRESGMQMTEAPELGFDKEREWEFEVLVEAVSLCVPCGIGRMNARENVKRVKWPAYVVDFRFGESDDGSDDIAVVDLALEDEDEDDDDSEGAGAGIARGLVRGSWRGSNAKVESEVNPDEVLGCALDAWKDALFASVVYFTHKSLKKEDEKEEVMMTVLIFGLRDGALPTFLAKRFPEVQIIVVENDERVIEFAEKHFKFSRKRSGVKIITLRNEDIKDENYQKTLSEIRDIKCDVIIVSDGSRYRCEEYLNLEGLTMPFIAISNAKTLPHANVLEATWEGPNIMRCVDPFSNEKGEEDGEDEEDDERAAKKQKRDEDDEKNSAAVEFFNGVQGTDVLLFNVHGSKFETMREEKLANLPFIIDKIDSINSDNDVKKHVKMESFYVSFAENEDDDFDARNVQHNRNAKRMDITNDAFSLFGDFDGDEKTGQQQNDVLRIEEDKVIFWERVTKTSIMCSNYFTSERICDIQNKVKSLHDWTRFKNDINVIGYASPENSARVFSADDEEDFNKNEKFCKIVKELKSNGYPATLAFVTDVAWEIVLKLWTVAEEVYDHAEVVLEPSFAAYALEKPQDKKGKYIGQNFGQPHRDYAQDDDAISLWLPLNNVDAQNGCIFVLPKADDLERDKKTTMKKDTPVFPIEKAVALAPVESGRLLGWSGEVVHWGTSCQATSKLEPRESIGLAFRKKSSNVKDVDVGIVGKTRSMTKSEALSLDLEGRLKAISVAIGAFEHWYGNADSLKAKLK